MPLSQVRNDIGIQTSHSATVALLVLLEPAPLLLLALAAVSRLQTRLELSATLPAGLGSLLGSPYIAFAIATAIIWAVLGLTLWASRKFAAQVGRRWWVYVPVAMLSWSVMEP